MSDNEIRLAIAEAVGWKPCPKVGCWSHWTPPKPQRRKTSAGVEIVNEQCPDFCNDLNAMAEARATLTPDELTDYIRLLNQGDISYRRLAKATARQCAEAFLKTKQLWKP